MPQTGSLPRCGPQGRPDNPSAPRRRTLMSEPRANCDAASSRRSLALAVRSSKSRAVVNTSSWTYLSATWRRSRHAHRGRQMTLEGIACLVAGFTARSIALAITSCNRTATRSRLTSKSRISTGHRPQIGNAGCLLGQPPRRVVHARTLREHQLPTSARHPARPRSKRHDRTFLRCLREDRVERLVKSRTRRFRGTASTVAARRTTTRVSALSAAAEDVRGAVWDPGSWPRTGQGGGRPNRRFPHRTEWRPK